MGAWCQNVMVDAVGRVTAHGPQSRLSAWTDVIEQKDYTPCSGLAFIGMVLKRCNQVDFKVQDDNTLALSSGVYHRHFAIASRGSGRSNAPSELNVAALPGGETLLDAVRFIKSSARPRGGALKCELKVMVQMKAQEDAVRAVPVAQAGAEEDTTYEASVRNDPAVKDSDGRPILLSRLIHPSWRMGTSCSSSVSNMLDARLGRRERRASDDDHDRLFDDDIIDGGLGLGREDLIDEYNRCIQPGVPPWDGVTYNVQEAMLSSDRKTMILPGIGLDHATRVRIHDERHGRGTGGGALHASPIVASPRSSATSLTQTTPNERAGSSGTQSSPRRSSRLARAREIQSRPQSQSRRSVLGTASPPWPVRGRSIGSPSPRLRAHAARRETARARQGREQDRLAF